MGKQALATTGAPKAIGPYSQGIKAKCQQLLFVSGQIASKPENGELVAGGIIEQTKQALENVKAIVAAGGGTLADVVKTTVYLTNFDDFTLMNETYSRFFAEMPPARATVQVAKLPKGAKIEIDVVAAL